MALTLPDWRLCRTVIISLPEGMHLISEKCALCKRNIHEVTYTSSPTRNILTSGSPIAPVSPNTKTRINTFLQPWIEKGIKAISFVSHGYHSDHLLKPTELIMQRDRSTATGHIESVSHYKITHITYHKDSKLGDLFRHGISTGRRCFIIDGIPFKLP